MAVLIRGVSRTTWGVFSVKAQSISFSSSLWLDRSPQIDESGLRRYRVVYPVSTSFLRFVQSTIRIHHWAIVICSHCFHIDVEVFSNLRLHK